MSDISELIPRLAIDTSTEYLSVALQTKCGIFLRHKKVVNKHSDFIIPFILDVLKQANISLNEIQLIAYTAGPGSFTGLRITLSVVKGIALPRNIPLVAIPTLDHIAYQVHNINPQSNIIALMDAKINEIFIAQYQSSPFKKIKSDFILRKNSDEFQTLLTQDNMIIISNNNFHENEITVKNILVRNPKADQLFKLLDNTTNYSMSNAKNSTLMYIRNKVALTHQEQRLKVK
ncbi:MAG: tRNA (adenosine(37)-N6)-threonylcarbamoyltransferase complex dimerization subunit type 1 TsaB [Neisseriaceae bacterium]|nr:MAG: tRNA (adenosine(37)-N6)-threonylcarbamoyltransferase complex dimerization subunit type 1 TsaB [Neisseriaceae bacterium]